MAELTTFLNTVGGKKAEANDVLRELRSLYRQALGAHPALPMPRDADAAVGGGKTGLSHRSLAGDDRQCPRAAAGEAWPI